MLSEEVKLICKEVKIDLAFVCFLFDFWQGQLDSNQCYTGQSRVSYRWTMPLYRWPSYCDGHGRAVQHGTGGRRGDLHGFPIGGDSRIRTGDILLAKQALYQLSYIPIA